MGPDAELHQTGALGLAQQKSPERIDGRLRRQAPRVLLLALLHPIVDEGVQLPHDRLAILGREMIEECQIHGVDPAGVEEVAAQPLELLAAGREHRRPVVAGEDAPQPRRQVAELGQRGAGGGDHPSASTFASKPASTLPPDSTATTGPARDGTRPCNSAATAMAPDGSTTSLARRARKRIASSVAASGTATMAET